MSETENWAIIQNLFTDRAVLWLSLPNGLTFSRFFFGFTWEDDRFVKTVFLTSL